MRTTLELDDVVLAAARSLARAQKITIGQAVSVLARRGLGLERDIAVDVVPAPGPFPVLIGDPSHPVTAELVREFRDGD